MEVKRLDRSLWHIYPAFEQRCRTFALEFDLKCPVELVLGEMLQRWIATPMLAGYFVALNEEGALQGHLSSWIQSSYNQNRVFIYQAAMSENDPQTRHQFMTLFREWLTALNEVAPPEHQVKFGEFVTWHDAEKWARYLKGIGVKAAKIRTVIQMEF